MAIAKYHSRWLLLFMLVLLSSCRDGHFEKARGFESKILWSLLDTRSSPCGSPDCVFLEIDLQAFVGGESVKNLSIESQLLRHDLKTTPALKNFTNDQGVLRIQAEVKTDSWLSQDRAFWLLHLKSKGQGSWRFGLEVELVRNQFKIKSFENLGSDESSPFRKDFKVRMEKSLVDAKALLISSRILDRASTAFAEDSVKWEARIQFLNQERGELLRRSPLRYTENGVDWKTAQTDAFGELILDFQEVHRPLEHERLRKKSLGFEFPHSNSPVSLAFYYSLDIARSSPVFPTSELNPMSLLSPTQAPLLAIQVVSQKEIPNSFQLSWREDLKPIWNREEELEIRVQVLRRLLDREESRSAPGLKVEVKIRAFSRNTSQCLVTGPESLYSVVLTEEHLRFRARVEFDRPSCADENFFWRIEVVPTNAPRIPSSIFLVDSNALTATRWTLEDEPFPIKPREKSEDYFEDFNDELQLSLQDGLEKFDSTALQRIFQMLLKRDRDRKDRELQKFIQGRESSLRLYAFRSWLWQKVENQRAVEEPSRFHQLSDGQNFEQRTWNTEWSGQAQMCLVFVLEVIPRISRSPLFRGEKRKLRSICSRESQQLTQFSERVSTFIPLSSDSPARRDRLVRGVWLKELLRIDNSSLIDEFDLLQQPQLYSWGSVIDSQILEIPRIP
jgi:hypothetical protein